MIFAWWVDQAALARETQSRTKFWADFNSYLIVVVYSEGYFDRRLYMLETYQMATRGQVLCQGLTQGLTNLGFPWLSQAEQ